MENIIIRNAVEFPLTKLKTTFGKIPESICGSYFRNGPGTLKLGQNVLSHWFYGNGALLKVQIKNGECWAKFKFLQTPKYKIQTKTQKFNLSGVISSMVQGIFNKNIKNQQNAANTSILRLKGSKDLYALYQGGLPFRVSQRSIESYDFQNLGFIKTAFSAHPKIDPVNQDVFNIGFEMNKLKLYRMSSDLKLIAENQVQLRAMQSIHDCCLAGQYLIVFQCPATFDKMKMIKGYTPLEALYFDYAYGKTHVWIFSKEDLKLVKKVDYVGTPFFMFHFTNGYADKDKIVVEYAKYPGQNAQKVFDTVLNIPQVTANNFKGNGTFAQLQKLEINLKDFSLQTKSYEYDCEFPVCEQTQNGKQWRYSYFIAKDKGNILFTFNKLVKFDRQSEKSIEHVFNDCSIGEPALIRTKDGLFVLILVTKKETEKSYVSIMNGDNLKLLAELQLPEIVPFGFHGKWQNIDNNDLLQSVGKQHQKVKF